MREFDAFHDYPALDRVVGPHLRTIHNRIAASYRDREFYDGARENGYGGFVNDGRWEKVAKNLVQDYNLSTMDTVLQLNAHKGFLLYELIRLGIKTRGCEISGYALANSMVRQDHVETYTKLPYAEGSADLVLAVSPCYMGSLADSIATIKEIQRVGKGRSFITLAAYEDESDIEGLMLLRYWFLTGTTILTKADWIEVLKHCGYTGNYRFDTAKYLRLRMA